MTNPSLVVKNGAYHIGIEVAAELCGVTTVTLNKWVRAPNPPPYDVTTGLFPLKELGDWIRTEQLFKTGKGGGYPFLPDLTRIPKAPSVSNPFSGASPATHDKLAAEAKLAHHKAEIAEMEEAKMRGTLIEADRVQSALTLMVTRTKAALLRIPVAIAPLVTGLTKPTEVQDKIDQAIRDALEKLSVNGWDTDHDEDAI